MNLVIVLDFFYLGFVFYIILLCLFYYISLKFVSWFDEIMRLVKFIDFVFVRILVEVWVVFLLLDDKVVEFSYFMFRVMYVVFIWDEKDLFLLVLVFCWFIKVFLRKDRKLYVELVCRIVDIGGKDMYVWFIISVLCVVYNDYYDYWLWFRVVLCYIVVFVV